MPISGLYDGGLIGPKRLKRERMGATGIEPIRVKKDFCAGLSSFSNPSYLPNSVHLLRTIMNEGAAKVAPDVGFPDRHAAPTSMGTAPGGSMSINLGKTFDEDRAFIEEIVNLARQSSRLLGMSWDDKLFNALKIGL